MNWLDRAIGAVAPGAGLRRARQRQMIAVLARAYEGAKLGRRTEGWVAAGTGANAEIAPAIARLRDRSRDLVRNNPYAAKAVHRARQQHGRHRAAAAGPGGDAGAGRAGRPALVRVRGAADADGLTDFAGLQALIVRSLVESGEVLVRLRERRVEDGLPVPLQLQVLEADHLDSSQDRGAARRRLRPAGHRVRRASAGAAPTGSIRRIPATAAGRWSRIGCRPIACCTSSSGCGPGRCAACRGSRR